MTDKELLERLEYLANETSSVISEEIERVCDAAHARIQELIRDHLTVRDRLAASVLPAIYEHQCMLTDRAAELAYEQADEMVKVRSFAASMPSSTESK